KAELISCPTRYLIVKELRLKPAAPAAVAAAEPALCLLSVSLSTTFFTFFSEPAERMRQCGSTSFPPKRKGFLCPLHLVVNTFFHFIFGTRKMKSECALRSKNFPHRSEEGRSMCFPCSRQHLFFIFSSIPSNILFLNTINIISS
ncbi:hypothetical protein, partial [Oleidesulfovibrio alaskensis]|uniref:hypothetical protein n=1 Tax=Oleidesulfovibrio alaskensis TaxID=58180 RepID=UPI0023570F71